MVFDINKHMATKGLDTCLGSGYKKLIDIRWEDTTEQKDIIAQVIYDRVNELPESGDDLVIPGVRITVSKSKLDKEIKAGDKIFVKFPANNLDENKTGHGFMDGDKAPDDGLSIGFISFYIKETVQE